MTLDEEIIIEARRLFDAAGVVPYNGDSTLVLGLVHSDEQDMDDFERVGDTSRWLSFKVHAQPRIERLINFIKKKGQSAEVVGPYGYPRGNVLNLKRLAVMAGLARWGKNAMVLHPKYGPRMRFIPLRVHGPILIPTGNESNIMEIDPRCQDCTACIDICPLGILEPFYMRDRQSCLCNTIGQTGKMVYCEECWKICPLAQI